MRRPAIRDLAFRHSKKPGLGFEIFTLSDLFSRMPAEELRTPSRLEFHLIYIGTRGKGSLMVDFEEVPIGRGYLTVVARGRVEHFLPKAGIDAWLLLALPELVTRTYALLDPMWMPPVVELEKREQQELELLCTQLAAEQARPLDAVQPALMESLLASVLLTGERCVHAAGRREPGTALQRFFTILEQDCLHTREVTHYAKKAGISVRQLADLLVARTGKSTKRVIDDRVVLEQKRLLAHTDVSVKQLADRTGFAEPTNLVKFFRHHTGTTPEAFRRNLPSGRRS